MNSLYQQTAFVEMYFQFLGLAVPKEFKGALISSTKNKSITPQIYIILAHIMRFYRNEKLESQFLAEANRSMSRLFECDNLESAVALLMMSLYLGMNNPKSVFYATTAYNITKLSNVETIPGAKKLQQVCQAVSVVYDSSSTHSQRCSFLGVCLPYSPTEFNTLESTMANVARLGALSMLVLKINHRSTQATIDSFFSSPFSEEDRNMMLCEVQLLEGIQYSENTALKTYMQFMIHQTRFAVEWRCANREAAFQAACRALECCRSEVNSVLLWQHSSLAQVLLLPCFFKDYGAGHLQAEILQVYDIAFTKLGKKSDLDARCQELFLYETTPQPTNEFEMDSTDFSLINFYDDSVLFTSSDLLQFTDDLLQPII